MRVCADCGKAITEPEDTDLASFAYDQLGEHYCDSCVRAYHEDLVIALDDLIAQAKPEEVGHAEH